MKVGQLDLNADPEGPEVRHLLMRVGMQRITSTRPAPDRFVYTVEYGDWRLTVPEQDSHLSCAGLYRSCSIALAIRSICTDRGAQQGSTRRAFDRVTSVPTGRARDRTYPRSVGVLGQGFLAESVLRRSARAAEATHISTYGRNPDLLTSSSGWGSTSAASAADLAARSEYVLVVLQKLEDLEADLSGPSGLQAGVHSPTILAVGAISTPDDLRSLASELVEKTAGLLRLVDAPLSGTPGPPPAANCPSWSARHQASIETHCPYWSCWEPAYASVVWAAPRLRTLVSNTSAATAAALSEAAVIAERAGLDWECCKVGSFRWRGAEYWSSARQLLNRDFEPDLPRGPPWPLSRLNKHGGPALQAAAWQRTGTL